MAAFDHVTAFTEITQGNQDAFECLNLLFIWFHTFDDLIDNDKPKNLSGIVVLHLKVLECVSSNPFFQKHKEILLTILQASSLAYLDSERFRVHENPLFRIGSQVLKSQYQDLFYAVARIVGGDAHMVRMSEKYRDFDFDPTPKPAA